jgi:RHS repeat-associated protein
VTGVNTPAGIDTYTYDPAGNRTTWTNADGADYSYLWDTQHRLTAATSTPGGTTSYLYDTDRQQVLRKDPNGDVTLFLAGTQEITRTANAAQTATRFYAIDGANVAVRTPTLVEWTLGDHHGSIHTTIDDTNTTKRTHYTPYGEIRAETNPAPTSNHRYLGQTDEPASNLNYLNNRYHDPQLGVFISVDPLVHTTGEPYIYANGNPTTLSDPLGLEPGCSATASTRQVATCAASHADVKYLVTRNTEWADIAYHKDDGKITIRNWWNNRSPGEQLPSWTMLNYGCDEGLVGCAVGGAVVITGAVAAAAAIVFAPEAVAAGSATCLRFAFWCTRLSGLGGAGAGAVNDAYGGPGAGSAVWSSTDDLVGPTANALERAFPGRVVGANQNVSMTTRYGYREIDVLMDGVYVQVKGGSGARIAAQVHQTAATTGVPTVGYAPGISNVAWEQAARDGVPIARSLDELVAIVRELAG